jgi:hypothetical protein
MASRTEDPSTPACDLTRVHTTLYELIEAIGEEVGYGEDALIAQTILNMLDSGRIKFHSDSRGRPHPSGN